MAERKFIEDKVYLQGPTGAILDYEPLVANLPGYTAVVPNKSAATRKADKLEAQNVADLEKQQAEDAEAAKTAQAAAAKATTETKTEAK